jgi:hypothetical protein
VLTVMLPLRVQTFIFYISLTFLFLWKIIGSFVKRTYFLNLEISLNFHGHKTSGEELGEEIFSHTSPHLRVVSGFTRVYRVGFSGSIYS